MTLGCGRVGVWVSWGLGGPGDVLQFPELVEGSNWADQTEQIALADQTEQIAPGRSHWQIAPGR